MRDPQRMGMGLKIHNVKATATLIDAEAALHATWQA